MKTKIMITLLILTLMALTLLSKAHVKTLVAVEPENNSILLHNGKDFPSEKIVSQSTFLGKMVLVRAKPQVKRKLLQKKTALKPEMPLFQINVEQLGNTYYLYRIRVKATLVPRSGDNVAKEAVKNKMVYFLIDGIYVGRAKASESSVDFEISTEDTPKFRFRPGTHKIMAQAAHDGMIFMGNGILKVDKGNAKIQETTSNLSSIYYGYEGQKHYLACHSEGDIITVSARFTDTNHPDIPVVGAKVYFRNHAVVLSEAKTDDSGEALFSYELTRASMLPSAHKWTYHEGRPLSIVQDDYNFFMEESGRYNETTDWGEVYRSMCACPYGYTLSKSGRLCIKKQ